MASFACGLVWVLSTQMTAAEDDLLVDPWSDAPISNTPARDAKSAPVAGAARDGLVAADARTPAPVALPPSAVAQPAPPRTSAPYTDRRGVPEIADPWLSGTDHLRRQPPANPALERRTFHTDDIVDPWTDKPVTAKANQDALLVSPWL